MGWGEGPQTPVGLSTSGGGWPYGLRRQLGLNERTSDNCCAWKKKDGKDK